MREFFHGWRRKAGVVTLVVALALMSGWLRSFRIHDQLWFAVRGDVTEAVISLGGKINWLRYHKAVLAPVPTLPEWETSGFDDVESFDDGTLRWSWRFVGFGCGEWPNNSIIGRTTIVTVPYLLLVLPLTLLSAYLILWKPRTGSSPISWSVPEFASARQSMSDSHCLSKCMKNRRIFDILFVTENQFESVGDGAKMEQFTLDDVTRMVEEILRVEFRAGITTISTLGIVQRLQDRNEDIQRECPLVFGAIQMMMKRKYIQHAHTPRGSAMWYARLTEGTYYEIRAASRINDNWVPTWFDIYVEKLTEAHEKSVTKRPLL